MKTLQETDVLRIMREEWSRKIQRLTEEIELTVKSKDGKPFLSPGLKVMHDKSGIRYTIDSVSTKDVILVTPEGEKFIVDAGDLEKEYHLD